MTRTIHGWPVIESGSDSRLKDFRVPGTKRSIKLRKDVGGYLVAFASEYHDQIAPIDTGTFDDWGWCPVRKGRASSQVSDHCGGVAMDLNATKEGSQSKSNVFWRKHPVKALRMRALLRKYRLLEWGGDYKSFYDPMHLVIKTSSVKSVRDEMARLGIRPDGTLK